MNNSDSYHCTADNYSGFTEEEYCTIHDDERRSFTYGRKTTVQNYNPETNKVALFTNKKALTTYSRARDLVQIAGRSAKKFMAISLLLDSINQENVVCIFDKKKI